MKNLQPSLGSDMAAPQSLDRNILVLRTLSSLTIDQLDGVMSRCLWRDNDDRERFVCSVDSIRSFHRTNKKIDEGTSKYLLGKINENVSALNGLLAMGRKKSPSTDIA